MPGIGATLREAREQAHLDIMDFEGRTKIRAKYLRALEDEEWSLLPGYTFTKGFLRTYADMLGLDGRALVDEFKRQYRDPSELEAPGAAAAARRDPRRGREQGADRGARGRPARPPIVVAVIVVVILIAAALYALGVLLPRNNSPSKSSRTHTVTTSTTHTHTHTHHTKTRAPGSHTPTVVALRLAPKAQVYICLVGYPGPTDSHRHVRRNGVVISPQDREPTFHEDHFRITVGNGQITLVVNGHHHHLTGSNPLSFKITHRGRVLPITTGLPHCG